MRVFIQVKEGDFTEQQLTRLARHALNGSSAPFMQVNLLGAGSGVPLEKPSHFSFQHWREIFDIAAGEKTQAAEAISMGRNRVLRVRQADGSIIRKVLSGRDPLVIELAGKEYDIVYFGFSGPNRFGLQESVFVFVRARGPVDSAVGGELLNRVKRFFPAVGVRLEIRNDAWFVYQDRYPFFNPFNGDRDVPSQGEYEGSPTLTCLESADGASCRTDP
jgi:hypothetical protein